MVSRQNLENFSFSLNLKEADEKKQFSEEIEKIKISDFKRIIFPVAFLMKQLEEAPQIAFRHDYCRMMISRNELSILINKEREFPIVEEEEEEKEELFKFDNESIGKFSNDFNFILGMLLRSVEGKKFGINKKAKLLIDIKEPKIQKSCIQSDKLKELETIKEGTSFRIYGIKIESIDRSGKKNSYIINENYEENNATIIYSSQYENDITVIDLNKEIDLLLSDVEPIIQKV